MYTKILLKKCHFSEKLCFHEGLYWLDKNVVHTNNILIALLFTAQINSFSDFLASSFLLSLSSSLHYRRSIMNRRSICNRPN